MNNCAVRLLIVLCLVCRYFYISFTKKKSPPNAPYIWTFIHIYQTKICLRHWTVRATKCIKHLFPSRQSVEKERNRIRNIFVLATNRCAQNMNMRQSTFWLIIKLGMDVTTPIITVLRFFRLHKQILFPINFIFVQQLNLSTRHERVCAYGY